jgi:predicted RNA binding protein YcfA (HicA-like mRNA interferase family)
MPKFGPVSRSDLLRALRKAGWTESSRKGGKHLVLRRGTGYVRIPNEHGSDLSTGLLNRILKEAGISREEWEHL